MTSLCPISTTVSTPTQAAGGGGLDIFRMCGNAGMRVFKNLSGGGRDISGSNLILLRRYLMDHDLLRVGAFG